MRPSLRPVRRLFAERLDSRLVLSGNVLGAVDDLGRLVVTGDNLSNNIVIRSGDDPRDLIVAGGQTDAAGSRTRVNGSLDPVTISGVTGAIIANMQRGYDQVVVTDLLLQASLQVAMGPGNDRLSIQSTASQVTDFRLNDGSEVVNDTVRLGVFARLDAGNGHDVVGLTNAVVTGNLDFNGRDGNDAFVQYGETFADNRIGGRARMFMDDGNDRVSIQRLEVRGDLTVTDLFGTSSEVHLNRAHVEGTTRVATTEGADQITIGLASQIESFTSPKLIINSNGGADDIAIREAGTINVIINAGSGENKISLVDTVARDTLRITAANSSDTISLDGVVTGVLFARTWGGFDRIDVNGVSAVDALFDLLQGNDELDLADSIFGRLRGHLGDGDDQLAYGSLRVLQYAEFDGGAGHDTRTNRGGNQFGQLSEENFES